MKKFILASIFLFNLSFGASFSLNEYKTPLIDVTEGVGTVADSPDIIVGSSGIVMHNSTPLKAP